MKFAFTFVFAFCFWTLMLKFVAGQSWSSALTSVGIAFAFVGLAAGLAALTVGRPDK